MDEFFIGEEDFQGVGAGFPSIISKTIAN